MYKKLILHLSFHNYSKNTPFLQEIVLYHYGIVENYIGRFTNQGGGVHPVFIRFGDFFTKNAISEPLLGPRPS